MGTLAVGSTQGPAVAVYDVHCQRLFAALAHHQVM